MSGFSGSSIFSTPLRTTDATASSSPTTGSLLAAGGLGIGGALHSALGLIPNAQLTTAWQFGSDASNIGPISVSSSSADFPAGTGLILVRENTFDGGAAMFLVGGTGTILIAQTTTVWGTTGAAGTTSPAASKCSVAYSGTGYRIYNGSTAGSRNFSAIGIAVLLGSN